MTLTASATTVGQMVSGINAVVIRLDLLIDKLKRSRQWLCMCSWQQSGGRLTTLTWTATGAPSRRLDWQIVSCWTRWRRTSPADEHGRGAMTVEWYQGPWCYGARSEWCACVARPINEITLTTRGGEAAANVGLERSCRRLLWTIATD